MPEIITNRLRLVAGSVELVQSALGDRAALERVLGVQIPAGWPQPDLRDFLPFYAQIVGPVDAAAGWGVWLLLRERTLIGDIGFKGAPAGGAVEIGYSVLPAFQRHGYASEAARALIAWALAQPGVQRIVAECRDDNAASIRVLQKLGLRQTGRGAEGIRWETTGDAGMPARRA